ncbi:uncharacterized protein RHO17_023523 [Thomomys bottae]
MDPVLEANGTFALNLLKVLCEDSSKNIFFSPISISSTLPMVLLGAKGDTADQIAQVLSFNKCGTVGDGAVHQNFQSLLTEVNKTGTQYLLRIANRLFGEKSYTFLSSFKDSCYKYYQAEIEELDFVSAAEESCKHINSWVAKKTEDKITELLSPASVTSDTRLVLVNAVYFKGNWKRSFDKKRTHERPFKVSKNEQKPVQMMCMKATFKCTYIGEIFTRILVLPYESEELSMIIMLPDEHIDLKTVEQEITYEKFVEWTTLDKMDEEEMEVSIPRFKLEENYDMKDVLSGMGMPDAFDQGKADFSGMSSNRDLYLSKVVHKSFVEVNEEGTEAAAATAAIMMMRMMTPRFCANRPFLFFIQHGKTNAILFCGRFASPRWPRGLGEVAQRRKNKRENPGRLSHLTKVASLGLLPGPGPAGLYLGWPLSLLGDLTPPRDAAPPRWPLTVSSKICIMNAISEANGTFAFHLLKILCQDHPSDNLFYSPVSISSALAMVLLGAGGNTAVQMAQTLSLNTEKDIHRGFQSFLSEVNKPGKHYVLRIANRLFGEKTCEFLQTFKTSCLQFYLAELEQLSFAKASEKARKHINTWVSKQTEGKIQDMLPSNSINEQTKLVLVNAIYFKGKWDEKFEEMFTKEMPFKINQKEQRPVQMMYQEAEYNLTYVKEVQAQVLELPYEGKELSMLVLLPDDGVDLSTVENNLTFEKFISWTKPDHMKCVEVEVSLPRFKLEENYDMELVLQRLGMVDAFQQGKADLSVLSTDTGLCLSKFMHKSFVEVNEEGTEAAAASAAVIVECCLQESEHRFCADHPFLFFIRHNRTNSLLFCGRFTSP